MPGQSVTLNFDQSVKANIVLKDSAGVVTTDLGTYSVSWDDDRHDLIRFIPSNQDAKGNPLAIVIQAAIPAVDGTANVTVTLTSSDPAAHPAITNSFAVTITNAPSPVPGPVTSVDFTIDAPGPLVF